MKYYFQLIKKHLLTIICLPILGNSIINTILKENFKYLFNSNNLTLIISFLLGSLFFYQVSKAIESTLKLSSLSLSIVIFLLSFFILDSIFLPLTKNITFKTTVTLVSTLWIIFILSKHNYFQLTSVFISYFVWKIFNKNFIENLMDLNNYIELNTDVPAQWFENAKYIYENNYFYGIQNNIIEGQGLLASYIQSLVLYIGYSLQNFAFIQTTANLFLFFSLLIIIDLEINTKNKLILSLTLFSLVLNSDWLHYLISNSLMIEGIVSFVSGVLIIQYKKFLNDTSINSILFFLCLGCLPLTKNFISLISLILIIFGIIFIKQNVTILSSFIVYSFFLFYQIIYSSTIQKFAYTRDLNYKDLFFDLILLRDLKLSNVKNIFNQLVIDKPFTYILIVFLVINLINISYKIEFRVSDLFIFFLVITNYLLINILYISYWQEVEFESSYRYIMNTFHLIFISFGIQLSKFEKYISS